MNDVTTAIARVIAMEAGANLIVAPGVAYDPTHTALRTLCGALLERLEGTGIELVALCREGATLVARIDESQADEPLCPAAFQRVVRKLAYDLLGEVWDGRLAVEEFAPAPADLMPAA